MLRDLRYSVRLIRRAPGFAAVAVLVLALGIGANVGVFSVVNTLVLQPRPGRIDTLVGVFNRDRSRIADFHGFSYPAYVDLRDRGDVFESLMAQSFTTLGVREGDVTRQTFAAVVSSNCFTTLGVPLAAGRPFTPEEERGRAQGPVAIASYGVWRRRGLDPSFVGSRVRINGADFTVVGVAPRGFGGVMAFVSPQWWLPLGVYESIVNDMFKERATGLVDRQNYALVLTGALKPGLARAAAEKALDAFAARLGEAYPGSDRDRTFVVAGVPRMAVSTRPQTDGQLSALAGLMLLMGTLVLAVACLNLANLLLARGMARRREIAIRQALGGRRRRIVQQLLIEGLVLSSMGAVCGLFAGWWTTAALAAWLGSVVTFGVDLVVEPSGRLVGAAAGFALLSTVLFALGPAWSLTRPDVAHDLTRERRRPGRRFGVSSLLVVGQLAMSVALVAAGGLFTRGAINAASIDAGFPLERQLVVGLDPSLAGYDEARTRATYRAVLDRVRSIPGVDRASLASTVPFGEVMMDAKVRPGAAEKEVDATFDVIGSDYFDTLGVRMVRGREFTRAEEQATAGPEARRVAIVDVHLARQLFAGADPLGRTVLVQARQAEAPRPYTIVGVAPAVRHELFEDPPRPHLYAAYASRFNTMMTLHVRAAPGAAESALLATIRGELQRVDNQLPILSLKTMTMQRDGSISTWSVRAAATLFTTFGALALLLAVIGVYGLTAYDVSRRTREIGIRMALGATSGDVERLMLRDGARAAVFGLGVGVLLAAGIGKLASGLLFHVSPFDPAVLAFAVLVLTSATLAASYLPARKATRVVPLDALRSE